MANLLRDFSFLLILWNSTNAIGQMAFECPVPDKSFAGFIERFGENINFQRSRLVLPLVVREGDYWSYPMTAVTVSLWDLDKIKSLQYPLILSKSQQEEGFVTEEVLLDTKRYVEVFHDGPPDSDHYRVLYKFRLVYGCWYLEEFHDRSL